MKGTNKVVILVVMAATAAYFFVYKSSRFFDESQRIASVGGQFEDPTPGDDEMSKQAALHGERKRHVMRQCEARPDHYYKKPLDRFLVDNKHHLVFCYVPKNGCSFWKRVLSILGGSEENRAVFDLSGTAIHASRALHHLEGHFFQMYHSLHSFKKVLFVRDPYERLFSGYIDKYFSPCSFQAATITSKFRVPADSPGTCPSGLSFTEFLQYVTNTKGVKVNDHFGRQYEKCLPCQVHYDYIGKMETFRQDVRFILRLVDVDPFLVLGPEENLEENSDVNIMNDVAGRSFERCRKPSNRCVSNYDMMLRLWVTFQVRGFLSVHEEFPLSREEAKRTTLQQFLTRVKAAYRQSGDRGVVKGQRQVAMLEAYHSVPRSLLARLQSYVAEDCKLFGYDCSIETRFNVSTRPEPLFHYDDILSNKK